MNAEAREVAPTTLKEELNVLQGEVVKVLPKHIGEEKFMRVVATAIAMNPDLRAADRRSLFTAAVKAATDGLVPDGREGAFVCYGRQVQWMPMVAGIIKKVRNSGELLSLTSNVVYEKDTFRFWIDDLGEHITHEPNVLVPDRGELVAVYAIAKTKDGGVYTEVMSRGQINQVRNVSRAKDSGPWKTWPDEMSRKAVIRRLSKRLPMSTDLEAAIQRDDDHYDLDRANGQAASSGVGAARAALGLLTDAAGGGNGHAEPAPDDEGAAGSAPPAEIDGDHYDEAGAVAAIRACKSLKKLETLADEIRSDFVDTGREVPVAVTAAIDGRREVLEAA